MNVHQEQMRRHNRIVELYNQGQPITRNERAVLTALDGLRAMASHDDSKSPFYCEYVLHPVWLAFGNMLDHNTGRLDCGTLSSEAMAMVKACGLDVDTGEYRK